MEDSASDRIRSIVEDHLSIAPDPSTLLIRLQRIEQVRAVMRPVIVDGEDSARNALLALLSLGDAPVDEVVRHPENLSDLLTLHRLPDPFAEAPAPLPNLVRYKRMIWLRILLRERLGYDTFETSAVHLARLADIVATSALEDVLPEGMPSPLLIAMGKWGGCELNVSSDIDPVFFGDQMNSGEKGDNLVRAWTRRIMESPEGAIYPVDLRLRPEGQSGPLVASFSEAERYFFQRAASWERIAYLRARPIMGEAPSWFQELLEAFLFSSTSDPKRRMDEVAQALVAVRRSAKTRDIKRGPGGIRDVEFVVAALQLTYGHTMPEYRHGSVFELLDKFREEGLLGDRDATLLYEGYRFVRRVEHQLQAEEDRPRFVVPLPITSEHARLAHAFSLTQEEFEDVWNDHRTAIATIAGKILPTDAALRHFTGKFLDPQLDEEKNGKQAPSLEEDPRSAATLRRLSSPRLPATRIFDRETLSPLFDVAETLLRLEAAVVAFGGADTWYSAFGEKKQLLREITRLLQLAPRLVEEANARPYLWERIGLAEWEPLLSPDAGSPELGNYLGDVLFHAGERFLANDLTVDDLTSRWSESVDCITRLSIGVSLQSCPCPAALVALGKWGGRELAPDADLDLMLVCRDGDADDVAETVKRGMELLKQLNLGGRLLPDPRLRPEGSGAPMVVTLSRLSDYLNSGRAQSWEKMALARARFIAGDPDLGRDAVDVLQAFAATPPATEEGWKRLDNVRRKAAEEPRPRPGLVRIKKSRGGMMDAEFAVTMAAWRHDIEPGEWWQLSVTARLESMASSEKDEIWKTAASAYRELRRWELIQLFTRIGRRGDIPLEGTDAQRFAFAAGSTVEEIEQRWLEISNSFRELYSLAYIK
ncbi:MAG: hypothetical protein V2A56_13100 [bacterium]